jgi:CHAD domain-containing protein
MNFAFGHNESVSASVKRLAAEQINLALDHLACAPGGLNESIHATRQSSKRVRALLALIRGELGEKTFKHEWDAYRSAARLLAAARDAAVVVDTFDSLVARSGDDLDANALAPAREFLIERRKAQLKMIEDDRVPARVCELLSAARERVDGWPVKRSGFKAIRRGLRRSYRSGREGFRGVIWHPTPPNFHEWRRPVKLLWHQLQVIAPIWPAVLSAHAEELHKLSDRLNENHDLDVLREIALWSEFKALPHDRQSLVSAIDRRCRELEAQALPLGERLYCERSRQFTKRIERYWRAWEHSHRTASSATIAVATSANQSL